MLHGFSLAAVLALSSPFLNACASSVAGEAATPAASRCSETADRVGTLTAAPTDAGPAIQTLRFVRPLKPEVAQQVQAFNVSGPCAATITSFSFGLGVLSSGERFRILKEGKIEPLENSILGTPAVPSAVLDGATGLVPQGGLISVARVDYGGPGESLAGDYLGVWRRRDDWLVASFQIGKAGQPSPAKPLLTSRVSLQAIGYFPAPDTQSGHVGLIQGLDSGAVRLFEFYWEHHDWFPPK